MRERAGCRLVFFRSSPGPSVRLHRRASLRKSFSNGLGDDGNGDSISLDSIDSDGPDHQLPESARRPRSSRGSQKWSNVRAVMALYSSLRKIKRYPSKLATLKYEKNKKKTSSSISLQNLLYSSSSSRCQYHKKITNYRITTVFSYSSQSLFFSRLFSKNIIH